MYPVSETTHNIAYVRTIYAFLARYTSLSYGWSHNNYVDCHSYLITVDSRYKRGLRFCKSPGVLKTKKNRRFDLPLEFVYVTLISSEKVLRKY